jgi:hypothetical protein
MFIQMYCMNNCVVWGEVGFQHTYKVSYIKGAGLEPLQKCGIVCWDLKHICNIAVINVTGICFLGDMDMELL